VNTAQYIINKIEKFGITTCFSVTGGGSMFLNDAIGKSKIIKKIYMHHEQSCSMAADAYARIKKKPALVCVTTGPGGINALNGVFGAFTDSQPMIIISGQVKRQTNMSFVKQKRIRQLGDQENDITFMSSKITKKSFQPKNQKDLMRNFSSLIKLANTGRPGPVWIDIPIDIQGQKI